MKRWEATGSVTDMPRSGRPRKEKNWESWDSIPRSVMEAQFSSIRGRADGKGTLPECIAAGGDLTRF